MPIYEYRCARCGRKESKFWRSLASIDEAQLLCSNCGSPRLERMVSRVRMVRGGGDQAEPGPDGDVDASLMREMEGLDENDPRALGRFMRKMAAQTGESLGDEFDEVVGRLEKGEDPERIEKDMGDLFGGPGEMGAGMDGDLGGPGGEVAPAAESTEPTTGAAGKPTRARRRPAVARQSTSRATPKAGRPSKAKRKK